MRKTSRIFLIVFLFFCCSCKEVVLHDLEEAKANKVSVVLSRAGIDAFKEKNGASWNIAVPADSLEFALETLEQSRLLKNELAGSMPKSSSLMPSREERHYWVEQEVSASLERTIETIPGVLEARVHLNRSSNELEEMIGGAKNDTASVLIVGDANAEIVPTHIKRLIEGGAGVREENITVMIAKQELGLPSGEGVGLVEAVRPKEPLSLETNPNSHSASGITNLSHWPTRIFTATAAGLIAAVFLVPLFRFRKKPNHDLNGELSDAWKSVGG